MDRIILYFLVYLAVILILYNIYPFYLYEPYSPVFPLPDVFSLELLLAIVLISFYVGYIILTIYIIDSVKNLIPTAILKAKMKGRGRIFYRGILLLIIYLIPFTIVYLSMAYTGFSYQLVRQTYTVLLIGIYIGILYMFFLFPLYIILTVFLTISTVYGISLWSILKRNISRTIMYSLLIIGITMVLHLLFNIVYNMICLHNICCLIYFRGWNPKTLLYLRNDPSLYRVLGIPSWIDIIEYLAYMISLGFVSKRLALEVIRKGV